MSALATLAEQFACQRWANDELLTLGCSAQDPLTTPDAAAASTEHI